MPWFDVERPGDFFGPEGWTGGDVEDLCLRQEVWDQAWALLTPWQRLIRRCFGSVRVDFEVVLAGPSANCGVYQDGVRLTLPAPDRT